MAFFVIYKLIEQALQRKRNVQEKAIQTQWLLN